MGEREGLPSGFETKPDLQGPTVPRAPDRPLTGIAPPGTLTPDLGGTLAPGQEPQRRTMFRRKSNGIEEASDAFHVPRKRTADRLEDSERYAFVGIVGEGAMGRIHLAEERQLLRRVAYKKMAEDVAHQAALASKFTLEARITAQLDHPNIVPVYSLESTTAYSMKLIQGRTLEDLLAEWRTVDRKRKTAAMPLLGRLDLFVEVCDAIWYAHSRGVLHRDLKPENIMVGAYGEVYVMDWGIARVFRTDVPEPVRLGDAPDSDEGDLIIGTPGYMSPEQAEGRNAELDARSDQYALGLVLFELLTLKRAVTGKAPLKIVMRHQDGDLDPLVHVAGEPIPRELVAIVRKSTAKDPAARYASVHDLAEDVRRFQRGQEVTALPDGAWRRGLRFLARHQVATLVVTLLVIFGSIGGAFAAFSWSRLQLSEAEGREQRVSNLLTTAAHQASLIDGQFLKYEGLLSLVAATTVDALTGSGGAPDAVWRTQKDFETPGSVPDLAMAKRYGAPISLQYPVFTVPPGTDPQDFGLQFQRLAGVRNHQYRALLRSHSEQAATYTPVRAFRAIGEVGVPVTWSYLGLENGIFESYPGHAGLPPGFDPRKAPWYALAKGRHGPTWGAPAVDPTGVGLVLSCAQSLYDDHENLLGVAGLDVSFDYLIENLLEAPEFASVPGVEFFLLDPQGHVAVRSSTRGQQAAPGDGSPIQMPLYPVAEVVDAIEDKRTGYVEVSDGTGPPRINLYNRMGSIGWYYVVSGPAQELMRFSDTSSAAR